MQKTSSIRVPLRRLLPGAGFALAAALFAAVVFAGEPVERACRGDGQPLDSACRQALARSSTADVLDVVERWLREKRHGAALQLLEQLHAERPRSPQIEQRLHEVRSLADEAAWLARRDGAAAAADADTALALAETRCTRLSGAVALAACDEVLLQRPQHAQVLAARGDLLLTLGRAAEALAAYRSAAAIDAAAAPASKIALAETAAGQAAAVPVPAAAAAGRIATDGVAFGRYHALLIGNDAYRHLERLDTAINDARAIGELLRRAYGFEVKLLKNSTRAEVVETLDDYRDRLGPGDNLLIYYAGHGWLDTEADKGFWLPVDAHPSKRTQWVSNDTVRDALRALRAKHVLVVADSCFSGTLTRGAAMRGANRNRAYVQRMARLKARQVLTSGGLEPVADSSGSGHSPFAAALIQVLGGNAGVLDATTLFAELRRPVALNSNQVPQFADIRLAGHEGGDFLFVRRR